MSARKLLYHKETRGDVIVEMVIWQLPENLFKGHINLNTDSIAVLQKPVLYATTMKRAKAIIATMASRKHIINSSQ
jgi:hypothetical protein